jgi:hypothetical protein
MESKSTVSSTAGMGQKPDQSKNTLPSTTMQEQQLPKSIFKKWWFWLIIAILVVGVVLVIIFSIMASSNSEDEESKDLDNKNNSINADRNSAYNKKFLKKNKVLKNKKIKKSTKKQLINKPVDDNNNSVKNIISTPLNNTMSFVKNVKICEDSCKIEKEEKEEEEKGIIEDEYEGDPYSEDDIYNEKNDEELSLNILKFKMNENNKVIATDESGEDIIINLESDVIPIMDNKNNNQILAKKEKRHKKDKKLLSPINEQKTNHKDKKHKKSLSTINEQKLSHQDKKSKLTKKDKKHKKEIKNKSVDSDVYEKEIAKFVKEEPKEYNQPQYFKDQKKILIEKKMNDESNSDNLKVMVNDYKKQFRKDFE